MSDFEPVLEVQTTPGDDLIRTEMPLAEIARKVIERQIVILKNAFPGSKLLDFRAAIAEWALSVPLFSHGTALQDVGPAQNIHRIDDDPNKSAAPHIYHTFNFNDFAALSPRLRAACLEIYEPMRRLQNELTENTAEFSSPQDRFRLRPQVMQYPVGGGFIASHRHTFLPQKIGLILNLSRRGIDYTSGGTRFELPGGSVDIEERHGLGDIALFRYDLDHEVTPVEPASRIGWELERGRWVAVLAYY